MTRREKDSIRAMPCGTCGAEPPFHDGSRCHPHRIIPGSLGGQYVIDNVVPRCSACHDIEHGGTGVAPFIGAARRAGRARQAQLTPAERSEFGRRYGAANLRKHHDPETQSRRGTKGGPIRQAALTAQEKSAFGRANGRKGWLAMQNKVTPAERLAISSKGGRRAHQLHPRLASENGRKGGRRVRELHPGLARENGLRAQALYPNLARDTCRARMARMTPEQRSAGARKAGSVGGPIRAHNRWHIARGIVNPKCRLCVGGA
jgi:general stress protein YciG